MKLESFDVTLSFGSPTVFHCPEGSVETSVISCTPQEAFTLCTMPALAGCIVKLVPNYVSLPDELSEMPKE